MKYNLDAKNEKLGRLASKVAILLMGKNEPDFARNVVADVEVEVDNISKLDISKKKMKEKIYQRYSGYPGGRKEETMEKVVSKKGYSEIFRKAVYGMLPANKLRAKMIKNLNINE